MEGNLIDSLLRSYYVPCLDHLLFLYLNLFFIETREASNIEGGEENDTGKSNFNLEAIPSFLSTFSHFLAHKCFSPKHGTWRKFLPWTFYYTWIMIVQWQRKTFSSASCFSHRRNSFSRLFFLPPSGFIHLIRIGCIVRNFATTSTCVTKIDLSGKDVVSSFIFFLLFFCYFRFYLLYIKNGIGQCAILYSYSR